MRRILSLVPEKPQSWCSASPCAADQSSMVVSLCWPTRQRVTTPRTMPRYVFTPERPRPRSRRPVPCRGPLSSAARCTCARFNYSHFSRSLRSGIEAFVSPDELGLLTRCRRVAGLLFDEMPHRGLCTAAISSFPDFAASGILAEFKGTMWWIVVSGCRIWRCRRHFCLLLVRLLLGRLWCRENGDWIMLRGFISRATRASWIAIMKIRIIWLLLSVMLVD